MRAARNQTVGQPCLLQVGVHRGRALGLGAVAAGGAAAGGLAQQAAQQQQAPVVQAAQAADV